MQVPAALAVTDNDETVHTAVDELLKVTVKPLDAETDEVRSITVPYL